MIKELDQAKTAQNFLSLRKARNISPIDLSESIGMSRTNYYLLENNKAKISMKHIEKIANFYNVPIEEIAVYKEYSEYEKGYLDGTADALRTLDATESCNSNDKMLRILFKKSRTFANILDIMGYKLYPVSYSKVFDCLNNVEYTKEVKRKYTLKQLSSSFHDEKYVYIIKRRGFQGKTKVAFISTRDIDALTRFTLGAIEGCIANMLVDFFFFLLQSGEVVDFQIADMMNELYESARSKSINYIEIKRLLENFGNEELSKKHLDKQKNSDESYV